MPPGWKVARVMTGCGDAGSRCGTGERRQCCTVRDSTVGSGVRDSSVSGVLCRRGLTPPTWRDADETVLKITALFPAWLQLCGLYTSRRPLRQKNTAAGRSATSAPTTTSNDSSPSWTRVQLLLGPSDRHLGRSPPRRTPRSSGPWTAPGAAGSASPRSVPAGASCRRMPTAWCAGHLGDCRPSRRTWRASVSRPRASDLVDAVARLPRGHRHL